MSWHLDVFYGGSGDQTLVPVGTLLTKLSHGPPQEPSLIISQMVASLVNGGEVIFSGDQNLLLIPMYKTRLCRGSSFVP